jgi:hypothetical protein
VATPPPHHDHHHHRDQHDKEISPNGEPIPLKQPLTIFILMLQVGTAAMAPRLTSLSLSGCAFSGDAASTLSGTLSQGLPRLKTLRLARCNLTGQQLSHLFSALAGGLGNLLQELDISGNEQVTWQTTMGHDCVCLDMILCCIALCYKLGRFGAQLLMQHRVIWDSSTRLSLILGSSSLPSSSWLARD